MNDKMNEQIKNLLGDTERVVMMYRDPHWAHVYWQVKDDNSGAIYSLQVYKTEDGNTSLFEEFTIHDKIGSRYLHLPFPEASFKAMVIRDYEGNIQVVSESNSIDMPASNIENPENLKSPYLYDSPLEGTWTNGPFSADLYKRK